MFLLMFFCSQRGCGIEGVSDCLSSVSIWRRVVKGGGVSAEGGVHHPTQYGQTVGGTHPSGMHTCSCDLSPQNSTALKRRSVLTLNVQHPNSHLDTP